MKTAQHKWSQSDGWRPNLPTGEVGRQSVVFVFGARSLMQAGQTSWASCATTSKGPPCLVARLPARFSATWSSTTR